MLLYEMKFLVPNYSYLQNPRLGGYRPSDPRFLCPLSSTEFVDPPPRRKKFLGTPQATGLQGCVEHRLARGRPLCWH